MILHVTNMIHRIVSRVTIPFVFHREVWYLIVDITLPTKQPRSSSLTLANDTRSFADKRWHSTVNDRQESGRTSFVRARIMAYWFHQCQVHETLVEDQVPCCLIPTRMPRSRCVVRLRISYRDIGARTSESSSRVTSGMQPRHGVGVEQFEKPTTATSLFLREDTLVLVRWILLWRQLA